MSEKLKVVPIGTPNLKDVPASLRKLADTLESDPNRQTGHAIVVTESPSGDLTVYGYGEVGSTSNEVGILVMAAMRLATGMV